MSERPIEVTKRIWGNILYLLLGILIVVFLAPFGGYLITEHPKDITPYMDNVRVVLGFILTSFSIFGGGVLIIGSFLGLKKGKRFKDTFE